MRTSPGIAGNKEFCPSSVRVWFKSQKDSIALLRFCIFVKRFINQHMHKCFPSELIGKKIIFSTISDDIDGIQAVVKRLNPEKENVEVQQPFPQNLKYSHSLSNNKHLYK